MSALITLHCEATDRYSTCAASLIVTDADTVPEARAAAERHGWYTGMQDRCPPHAGRPGVRTARIVSARAEDGAR